MSLVPRFPDQLQLAVTDPFGYPLAESLSPLGVFLQMVSGPYLLAAGVQNSLDGLFQRLGHEHHVPGFSCGAGHRSCVASLFVRLFDGASRLFRRRQFLPPHFGFFIESVHPQPVAQARWRALDASFPGVQDQLVLPYTPVQPARAGEAVREVPGSKMAAVDRRLVRSGVGQHPASALAVRSARVDDGDVHVAVVALGSRGA